MTLPDALPRVVVVNAFYKPAFAYGGPVRSLATLCEGAVIAGTQIHVLTTDAGGRSRLRIPLNIPQDVDGVPVTYTPLGRPALGGYFYAPDLIRAFERMLADTAFRVTVAHLEVLWTHAAYPLMRRCQQAGIPYTTSLRGQLLPYGLRRSRLRKWLYLRLFGWRFLDAAAAIHCTDLREAAAAERFKLRPPLTIIPNGIDLAPFADLPERGAARLLWQIPQGVPLLLFAGRLHPKKRPEIAVETLAALDGAHLIIAGADEMGMTAALQMLARAKGCSTRLHFTGLLSREVLMNLMSTSDLLIMPSEPESENFGMAAAEALGAGLPILTTQGIPVGEQAQAVGAGLTVKADAQSFVEGAKALLSDQPGLQAMGARGRALAFAEYDSRQTVQKMISMWLKAQTVQ